MPRPSLSILTQAAHMSRQSSTSSTSTATSSSTTSSHHTQPISRLYQPPSYPSTTPAYSRIPNTRAPPPAPTPSQRRCLSKSIDLEALSLNDLLTLDPRYDSCLSSSSDPVNPCEGGSEEEEMEMPPAYEFKEEFPPDCQFEVVEICPSDDDDEQEGQRERQVVSRVVSLSTRTDLMRIVSRIEQKGVSRWWSRKGVEQKRNSSGAAAARGFGSVRVLA